MTDIQHIQNDEICEEEIISNSGEKLVEWEQSVKSIYTYIFYQYIAMKYFPKKVFVFCMSVFALRMRSEILVLLVTWREQSLAPDGRNRFNPEFTQDIVIKLTWQVSKYLSLLKWLHKLWNAF